MKILGWLVLIILLCGCTQTSTIDQFFEQSTGHSIQPSSLSKDQGLVLVFISPVCPLCQNYSVTLKDLANEYSKTGINVLGIVSGNYYSTEEILNYEKEYAINFPVIIDPEFKLSSEFKTEITPEVVLLDSLGQKKYRGAIDNWAISLGQKRQTITAWYLKDALNAYVDGNKIEIENTKAVGCFIE